MANLTVVMSGFDPYDGVEINPSLIVPRMLAERGIPTDPNDYDDPLHGTHVTIHSVVLPVSFGKAWPQLKQTIDEVHPDIVIATGLKRAARGILLERCAENITDTDRPDADNVIPPTEPIDSNGPAAYWTGLPLRAILRNFGHDNIPATLSSDAGTFVCNALFYQMQNWASQQDKALAGFVNLPLVNEQPHPQHGLPLEQQIHAAQDVVRQSAIYFLSAVRSPRLLP